tara:strand:- start:230 stop:577 length:348 start_codon:yes stop_codon:yes gene_type:complete
VFLSSIVAGGFAESRADSGRRSKIRPSLVNLNPLAVASEPRLPLIQPAGESYTSPLVVNLLAAEALVARHKGRTGQSATSTVVRAGVIVVGHVFLSLFRSCECVLYHAAAVLVNP